MRDQIFPVQGISPDSPPGAEPVSPWSDDSPMSPDRAAIFAGAQALSAEMTAMAAAGEDAAEGVAPEEGGDPPPPAAEQAEGGATAPAPVRKLCLLSTTV